MACTSATTHEFAEGASACLCGKARTAERTVMWPPPVNCFVCGKLFTSDDLDAPRGVMWEPPRGPRHATCNPARVCKCGALAPEGMVWAPVHGCSAGGPCATHSTATCCVPDPLYKPKPKTFTLAEVKGMSDAALGYACALYVLSEGRRFSGLIDWNFAMACRDAAVKRTKAGAVLNWVYALTKHKYPTESATPADFARAALLAVAGEGAS